MSEHESGAASERGEPLLSNYEQVRASIAAVLESEVTLDGTPRSQCYTGEVEREEGITKWAGFREDSPAGPHWVVQEEVAEDGAVYYVTRFIGMTLHGFWGVHLGRQDFGSAYINRAKIVLMREPVQDDLEALTKRLPEKFQGAQNAGRIEYPLRSVKTVQSPILGAL